MVTRFLVFFCLFSLGFFDSHPISTPPPVVEQEQICDEGFLAGTLIKTTDGYKPIEELSVGDQILSVDGQGQVVETKITQITRAQAKSFVLINLGSQSLLAASGQKFYLPESKLWVKAKDLSLAAQLLAGTRQPCAKSLQLIEHPAETFAISLDQHHNFFVTKSDVLVHNAFPVVISISYAFGSGLSAKALSISIGACIGGLGVLGFNFRKRDRGGVQIQPVSGSTAAACGGFPDPDHDPDKNKKRTAHNMREFYREFEFGKILAKNSEKYKVHDRWGNVYRVTKNLPEYGLKKGDQYYLDTAKSHGPNTGDHLEFFKGPSDKAMRGFRVLNLFGEYLEGKTNLAKGRLLWTK